MNNKITEIYIQRVLSVAELPAEREAEVRDEIADHLARSIEAEEKKGLNTEDATWAAIRRYGHPRMVGQRLMRPWQWVDIRQTGTARGFIAMGPRAVGFFAFGGMTCGVVSLGGMSAGLITGGGVAFGLAFAWGGIALGGIANGGLAIGLVAMGGCAIGLVAEGAMGIGQWVSHSGKSFSAYSSANVPNWLRSLSGLLALPRAMNAAMYWIMPLYLILVLGLSWIANIVGRRPEKIDDWLFD